MRYRCKLCGARYDNLGDMLTHLLEHDTSLLEEDTPIEIVGGGKA